MMNPLTDVIPPRARRYVYAGIALAALVWGAWEAAGGSWQAFVGGVLVALVNATAASNTPKSVPPVSEDRLRDMIRDGGGRDKRKSIEARPQLDEHGFAAGMGDDRFDVFDDGNGDEDYR